MAAQAVAFDFTAGYINIVNFGFAAFVGLGGYTSGLLAVELGIPPVIGMVVGGAVSGFVGLVTGALTLRLRGIYAAVMAWFVGLALMGIVRNLPEITRGSLGLAVPSLLDSPDNLPYYYVILAMLVVTFGVLAWVIRSRFGLAFRAIGQNLAGGEGVGHQPDALPGHQLHPVVRLRGLARRLLRSLLRDPDPGRDAHLAHRRGPGDRLHRRPREPVGRRGRRIPAVDRGRVRESPVLDPAWACTWSSTGCSSSS